MSISTRKRFEVFKRDSFTCQYCGKKAPEVILHVDHIVPASKGGSDDVLNLVTSCAGCNLGKSNIELDSSAAVSKAHNQASELQERKNQIEMMAEWYAGLSSIEDQQVEIANDRIKDLTPYGLSESGKASVKGLIAKYGLIKTMDALSSAFSDGASSADDFEIKFKRFQNVLKYADVPYHIQKAKYLTAVIRNRFPSWRNWLSPFTAFFKVALEEQPSLTGEFYHIVCSGKDPKAICNECFEAAEDAECDMDALYEAWNGKE